MDERYIISVLHSYSHNLLYVNVFFFVVVSLNFRMEEDIFSSPPGIFVTDRLSAFKLLRNFGHLIKNLYANFLLFNVRAQKIEHYLDEYCSE